MRHRPDDSASVPTHLADAKTRMLCHSRSGGKHVYLERAIE